VLSGRYFFFALKSLPYCGRGRTAPGNHFRELANLLDVIEARTERERISSFRQISAKSAVRTIMHFDAFLCSILTFKCRSNPL